MWILLKNPFYHDYGLIFSFFSLTYVSLLSDILYDTAQYLLNGLSSLHNPKAYIVMTVHLGLIIFLRSIYFPFHPLIPWMLSFTPWHSLEFNYLLILRLWQDAMQTMHFPLLSMTCLALAPTVPLAHASVPVDVHPLCPSCAHISTPSPYVSLHHLCTLSGLFTCILPCPLYLPQ